MDAGVDMSKEFSGKSPFHRNGENLNQDIKDVGLDDIQEERSPNAIVIPDLSLSLIKAVDTSRGAGPPQPPKPHTSKSKNRKKPKKQTRNQDHADHSDESLMITSSESEADGPPKPAKKHQCRHKP